MVVKDAGTETGFLCFPRCYGTKILHKPKGEIKQGHTDIPTIRFTTAVISTHQKQPVEESCYARIVSIFPGSGLSYLGRILWSVGIIFTPET